MSESTVAEANGSVTEPSAREVRAWAKEKGIAVGERGSLPGAVVAQFKEEQAAKARRATKRAAPAASNASDANA